MRGFSQKEGVNYEDTFSLVTMYTSIMTIISLASIMGWRLYKIDVRTTFLNVVIEEGVHIDKPHGFMIHGKDSHVCRLMKELYRRKHLGHGILGLMDT